MALPKMNSETPVYELKLPTTGVKYKYRPFLVKEQKSMLISNESGSQKEAMTGMLNCLQDCVPDLKLRELSTAEVDYMFITVRGKAVGETATLQHTCPHCSAANDITIKFDDISIINYNQDKTIKLNDDYTLIMKYPTYEDTLNSVGADMSTTELIFETLKSSFKSLQTEEENIEFKDETKEEIDQFINSLSGEQLEKCMNFVQNSPALYYEGNYECKNCHEKVEYKLNGFQDFL